MNTRRAASLAELLVIMSACTVILATSVSLIHRALQSQTSTRKLLDAERSAERLSVQFRRDVHAARTAKIESGKSPTSPKLRLSLAENKTIEYRTLSGEVVRTLSAPDAPTTREEFAFPQPLRCMIEQAESPRRLALSLQSGPAVTSANNESLASGAFAAPTELHVDARLGSLAPAVTLPSGQKESP